jgi:hypothetical protein
MLRFFGNKITFGVIFALFTGAFAWNNSHGATIPAGGHLFMNPALVVAHGPNMPPDPWDVKLAQKHGPNMPPDPWDVKLAQKHGPNMPPDPWDVRQTVA